MRVEGVEVDTQALQVDIADAQAAQLIGHDLAGCQDPVEIAIEFADIGLYVGSEPVAHAIADEQGQVRVIEANDRDIQLAACVERGPGCQVGVADFNKVRLQVVQDIAPGGQAQRKAVTIAEGQGGGGYLVDAILSAEVGPGDQQAVADPWVEAKTAMLGIKIGTHPAAGGGIEHGDVRDMHDQHPSEVCAP
ncbi:hypothetical protein D3C84_295130 [compost metagenome]